MIVDVILHPRDLQPMHLDGRVVVVFDVLRATTTLTTALANGAKEVRAFDSIDSARAAAEAFDGPKLLCGEKKTLPPEGFDLGNSPGDYTPQRVEGKTIFFTTTNGTRAIVAALNAKHPPRALYAAALVNASAAARAIQQIGADVTLLCSGSDGMFSLEDFLGAGAVLDELDYTPATDAALAAHHAFKSARSDLHSALRSSYGGQNNIRVGLDADVKFASQLNVFDALAVIEGPPPIARLIPRLPRQ